MTGTVLDHIVIAAPSLQEGVQYVESVLGVSPQAGGAHPRMGTHNRLLRLGPDVYLEVIAIDPAAPAPHQPRWFGLDSRGNQPPCLITWVVRSTDIAATCAAARMNPGHIQPMTRDTLSWQITIPDNGELIEHGLVPSVIQWATEPYPASRLPDQGCTLLSLDLFHPEPERLQQQLDAIGLQGCVHVCPANEGQGPTLRALIQTPNGVRQL